MTGTEASYIFQAITTAFSENFTVAAALKSDPICNTLSESMVKEKKTAAELSQVSPLAL